MSLHSLFGTQRVLSRQEELKERARLLLEQARRDAALKASNKNNPSSTTNAANRTTNICDVSLSDSFSGSSRHILKKPVSVVLRWFKKVGDWPVSACLFAACSYSIASLCWNQLIDWPPASPAFSSLFHSLLFTTCATYWKNLFKLSGSVAVHLVERFMEKLWEGEETFPD